MKHSAILMIAFLGLTGCSVSEPTASHIFEAANQTDFIQKATSISCRENNIIKDVSFHHKCWERDIMKVELDSVGQEALRLGLALQKAFRQPFEIVENDIDGFFVWRGETKDDCAHYIQAYMTPVEDETAPYTISFNLGVTKKPHCGPLNLSTAS